MQGNDFYAAGSPSRPQIDVVLTVSFFRDLHGQSCEIVRAMRNIPGMHGIGRPFRVLLIKLFGFGERGRDLAILIVGNDQIELSRISENGEVGSWLLALVDLMGEGTVAGIDAHLKSLCSPLPIFG